MTNTMNVLTQSYLNVATDLGFEPDEGLDGYAVHSSKRAALFTVDSWRTAEIRIRVLDFASEPSEDGAPEVIWEDSVEGDEVWRVRSMLRLAVCLCEDL